MASIQDLLGITQGQQAPTNPVFNVSNQAPLQALDRTQDQQNWIKNAQNNTASINAMPFVLDPNKLSTDTAANKALMYPAILQTGAAPYTDVGGKNIGPDLQNKLPTGSDWSGQTGTLDQLVNYVSQQTGMSADSAKSWIMGLLPNNAGGSAATTITRPTDTTTNTTQIYNN